jgi:site-specific recombinase XerD
MKIWSDPKILEIWRENGGLRRSVIQHYRYKVNSFINYCASRKLSEKTELTLVGAKRFSRWYARSRGVGLSDAFNATRSALGMWVAARRTMGEDLPGWKFRFDPLASIWSDPKIENIWRENGCLKRSSIQVYRYRVSGFIRYCASRNLSEGAELTLAGTERFSHWYARSRGVCFSDAFDSARAALGTWAAARRTLGEDLPEWKSAPDPLASISPLLREFTEHLRDLRGNPTRTLHKRAKHLQQFLAFLHTRRRCLHRTRLTDIDAFLIKCRERYARPTAADIACSLRAFMRFMRASGRIKVDLAPSIVGPIVRRAERPHRALPWKDVQRILRAIDRSTPCGRRDYALLLMMSTYGLGAGEIICLMLDDIDWQAATLRVHRPKNGVEFLLPLLPAMGRALASYLRDGRPMHAQTRNLFITHRAPHKALACSVTIRHILHTHAQAAGVSAPFLGTHVLRHTHACRQLQLGTRPKVIGDILGHRDPESTSTYLRASVEGLREIALPVPR